MTSGGRTLGEITRGLVVLLGIGPQDTDGDVDWLVQKILPLRIFPDGTGQMNASIQDVNGGVLVVSQFTLYASTRKGTRPSFSNAARPEIALPLYNRFITQMGNALGRSMACGEFGAEMQVSLINDGPMTIVIDSQMRE